MFAIDFSFLWDSLLIFVLAFLIDLVFGEPPDRIHPTLWMGKIADYLKPKLKNENPVVEKINGVTLCLLLITLFAVPAYLALFWVRELFGWLPYILASAIILKTTFAIKCMRQYTLPVADAVEKGDYDRAKRLLPFIVRRSPKELTERHIISAAVETIAEGTTDGITSPFFFFALFGVPGAVAFRVVNTLDSMVGYKDPEHINIGWFSANMDTIANYVPARLTAVLMVLAAYLLREDGRESWRIIQRDRNNMASVNAGWTISAMAGALNIQLEKPGHYRIGDNADLSPTHIKKALRIMTLTATLFGVSIILPLLALKTLTLYIFDV
ncbi:MAG TPA: cobalamin biosynthesis protein [Candidatus Bathyarchaeota archaeon]|nr:cobalamin biosynthesis protein [Candidatus Bathyarchaeota archaeon]